MGVEKVSLLLSEEQQASVEELTIPPGAVFATRNPDGTETELPAGFQAVLGSLFRALRKDRAVELRTMPDTLTTDMASDVLGVSRQTVLKWAAEGSLASFKVGPNTRFNRDDVLKFKNARETDRERAFDELRQAELKDFGVPRD